jgi:hypothetical protein
MMERVAGMISAAPTPMPTRAAMSASIDVDSAATTEVPPNTTSPSVSMRRRPKRSPRPPASSSSPPKARA